MVIDINSNLKQVNITNLVADKLNGFIDEIKIQTWIKPLDIEKEDNIYIIKSDSRFTLDIIERKYLKIIKAILENEYDIVDEIKLEYIKGEEDQEDIINRMKK